MKSFGAWFGRLAMAGTCLAWAGCGGGDVPDPDSDRSAATEAPASKVVDNGAAAPAPAEAPTAEAPAKAEPTAVAVAPPAAEPDKLAPAEGEKASLPVKGDASGTEEMLRIAGTPAATPPTADATAGAPTTNASGPGDPAMAGRPFRGPGGPGPDSPGGPGTKADESGGPPGRDNFRGRAMAGAVGGPGGMPDGPGGMAGGPGMAGMPGGRGGPGEFTGMGAPGRPGGTNDPNDKPVGPDTFNHANTAVMAFLSALKAKNKDRLAQATALRAPTEAAEKHQKIFAEIIDGSISEDELDEMSKSLDGFQVVSVLQAKSSGRVGVVVSKMDGRDRLQRTITVRKEKEGWKVLDISNMLEFKPMMTFPTNRGRRRP